MQKIIYEIIPKDNEAIKLKYLFKLKFLARKQTLPMQMLAAKILREEIKISFDLKSPIFFLKSLNKIKKATIPDIELAKAIPLTLSGNIRKEIRIIFNPKLIAAILVGVIVSLRLKKQDCNIFVPE